MPDSCHGTKANLNVRDLIESGHASNHVRRTQAAFRLF
jgi:hypothetical protein